MDPAEAFSTLLMYSKKNRNLRPGPISVGIMKVNDTNAVALAYPPYWAMKVAVSFIN